MGCHLSNTLSLPPLFRRARWVWKWWIYCGWHWGWRGARWRRESRQWWRATEEEKEEEKVSVPSSFFLTLACGRSWRICMLREANRMSDNRWVFLLNWIYIITLARAADWFSPYKTFSEFFNYTSLAFFKSSMHMGWFLPFSPATAYFIVYPFGGR